MYNQQDYLKFIRKTRSSRYLDLMWGTGSSSAAKSTYPVWDASEHTKQFGDKRCQRPNSHILLTGGVSEGFLGVRNFGKNGSMKDVASFTVSFNGFQFCFPFVCCSVCSVTVLT